MQITLSTCLYLTIVHSACFKRLFDKYMTFERREDYTFEHEYMQNCLYILLFLFFFIFFFFLAKGNIEK